jgi:hypothetical protein
MTPKKRIAIFASVSTPQQASVEKDSLPSQIRDGMAWAAGIDRPNPGVPVLRHWQPRRPAGFITLKWTSCGTRCVRLV